MLLTGRADSYAQFIAVLAVFILVLSLTALTTKWIAGYQKKQSQNCNIEILETTRISSNKYIQLVRIGEICLAIAVCKDTVTLLKEVPPEQLKESNRPSGGQHFKDLLEKAMKPKE